MAGGSPVQNWPSADSSRGLDTPTPNCEVRCRQNPAPIGSLPTRVVDFSRSWLISAVWRPGGGPTRAVDLLTHASREGTTRPQRACYLIVLEAHGADYIHHSSGVVVECSLGLVPRRSGAAADRKGSGDSTELRSPGVFVLAEAHWAECAGQRWRRRRRPGASAKARLHRRSCACVPKGFLIATCYGGYAAAASARKGPRPPSQPWLRLSGAQRQPHGNSRGPNVLQ